jgi:hypothetical protein
MVDEGGIRLAEHRPTTPMMFGTLSAKPCDRRFVAAIMGLWSATAIYTMHMIWLSWPRYVLKVDFISFWTAASLLRKGAGANLFDPGTQQQFQSSLLRSFGMAIGPGYNPFPSLPVLALPYLPLTLLPMPMAYLIWDGASFLMFLVALGISLGWDRASGRWMAAFLAFGAVSSTLLEGQAYAPMMLILSLAVLALRSGRPFLGGMVLGLLAVKPQYVVLFPLMFLIKGRWRELWGMTLAVFVMGALSVALVGPGGIVEFVNLLRQIGSFDFGGVNPQNMINWRALLMHLWPGIPDSTGSALVLLLGGGTVLAMLPAWRGPWEPRSARFSRQLLATMLAAIVASPHSHFHGLVLPLVPLGTLVSEPDEGNPLGRALRWTLFVGYALSSVTWVLVGLRWLMAPLILAAMVLLVFQRTRSAEPRPQWPFEPLARIFTLVTS